MQRLLTNSLSPAPLLQRMLTNTVALVPFQRRMLTNSPVSCTLIAKNVEKDRMKGSTVTNSLSPVLLLRRMLKRTGWKVPRWQTRCLLYSYCHLRPPGRPIQRFIETEISDRPKVFLWNQNIQRAQGASLWLQIKLQSSSGKAAQTIWSDNFNTYNNGVKRYITRFDS